VDLKKLEIKNDRISLTFVAMAGGGIRRPMPAGSEELCQALSLNSTGIGIIMKFNTAAAAVLNYC